VLLLREFGREQLVEGGCAGVRPIARGTRQTNPVAFVEAETILRCCPCAPAHDLLELGKDGETMQKRLARSGLLLSLARPGGVDGKTSAEALADLLGAGGVFVSKLWW
jgi:hypothetical protein